MMSTKTRYLSIVYYVDGNVLEAILASFTNLLLHLFRTAAEINQKAMPGFKS